MAKTRLHWILLAAGIACAYAATLAEVKCILQSHQYPFECAPGTLSVFERKIDWRPNAPGVLGAETDYAYGVPAFEARTGSQNEAIIAKALWDDAINKTGWSFATVRTAPEFTDAWQVYGAGYVEGYVSATRITQSIVAQNQSMFDGSAVTYEDLDTWVQKQRSWMLEHVGANPNDAFWRAVGLTHQHIVGMQDGYAAALTARNEPVVWDLLFWNQRADLEDVQIAIGPQSELQSCWQMPPEVFSQYERRTSHCSVRLTYFKTESGETDFAVAHNTWDDYRSMLRTWKNYIFPLSLPLSDQAAQTRAQSLGESSRNKSPATAVEWLTPELMLRARRLYRLRKGYLDSDVSDDEIHAALEVASRAPQASGSAFTQAKKISQQAHEIAAILRRHNPYIEMFSSYPGIIQSIDDFYMLPRNEQRLIITETTNSICNADLFKLIVPASLLTWHRVVATNLLAPGGESWTSLSMRENSGTYNNQFMVVDAKYLPEVPDEDELQTLVWIVEQYPGGFERTSIASHIAKDWGWSSYNRPYFPKVFDIMGFSAAEAVWGDYYSYSKTARARIFARETADTKTNSTLPKLKSLMRLNRFQTDELSNGDPSWTIASRYDLFPPNNPNWGMGGAIDVKIASVRSVHGHVGGSYLPKNPHHAHAWIISGPTTQDQPPFSWEPYPDYLHPGFPTVMNFDWVTTYLNRDEL